MKKLYVALISRRDASALLIAVAVAAVYANSLDNSFQFDDRHSIVENHHLRSTANIPAFFSQPEYFSRDPEKAMYRPLLLVTFALNYAWGQYEVCGYHLVNIALHLLCALCAWGVLRHLDQPPCMSLLGALFFAVHPLASEPVNYISSRSELMAAAGVLGGLLCYLQGVWSGRWVWHGVSALCLAAGVLSKSVALALPVWILLWEWERGHLRRALRHIWPHALVALAYVLTVRTFLLKAVYGDPVRSAAEQVGTQIKALVYYASLLLAPYKLNVDHAFGVSGMGDPTVWLCALALGSLLLLVRGQGRLGIAWMLVALLPTLVVPLNVLVNEHRLYLPLFGLVVALLGLSKLEETPGLRLGAPLLLGLLALMTWERNGVWRDEFALWSDAHAKNPTATRPLVYMGNAARAARDPQAAEGYYVQALALEPDNAVVRANLANAYENMGRHRQAIDTFAGILAQWPEMTDVHYSLGRVLQVVGRADEAAVQYRALPVTSPHRKLADNNLGTLFEQAGRVDSALYYYRRAGALQEAEDNYRRLFGRQLQQIRQLLDSGQLQQAELSARVLVSADSEQRDAHFLFAVSLYLQRRYGESLAANEELVRRHPRFAEGLLQLALVQEASGRLADALATYERLLQQTGQDEMMRIGEERLRALKERMP